MQRILLLLAGVVFLALPAAATARLEKHPAPPGFLVVRNASADGGVAGDPVVTVVVRGFVLGHIAQEGAVELYRVSGSATAQAGGAEVSRDRVKYRTVDGTKLDGTKFSGSGFRFRAVGGVWRVVVYGSGVSLYAGGEGRVVSLHGSVAYPDADGNYSLNGGPFASLPSGTVTGRLGAK